MNQPKLKTEKDILNDYEDQIGIDYLRRQQESLRYNSRGKEGKTWLALSIRRINESEQKRLKTKFEIAYWVNYGDDETYGLFTVEKIKRWLSTPDLLLYKLGGTRERVVHIGR